MKSIILNFSTFDRTIITKLTENTSRALGEVLK